MEVAVTASMRADTAGEDGQGHADGEVRSAVVQRAREFGGPTPSNATPRLELGCFACAAS